MTEIGTEERRAALLRETVARDLTRFAADPWARVEELERSVAKLRKINAALINRVERNTDHQGNSFSLFQTAILLEKQVRERTDELEHALHRLEHTNRDLSTAKEEADTARTRLTEAVESLSEGFVLFDADDRLVLFNSKYRAVFESMSDLVRPGITFEEFLRRAVERRILLVKPRNVDAWVDQRMQQHRNPGPPILHALEDGRWLQVSERRTWSGGTVGLYTDVTEIKKVETQRRKRELAEKSVQLTATLDHLVQGVSVFDSRCDLAYWNNRFLYLMGVPAERAHEGVPFEHILGCDEVRQGFPGTDLVADLIDWRHGVDRDRPFRAEYHRRDGLVIEVRRNAMPDGGFVSTYTDVTEQRRTAKVLEEAKESLERRVAERTAELTELNAQLQSAKAEADRANLSKTKFLAAASHDLLQPLNAARLFVSALMDSHVPAEAERLVGRVDTSLGSVDKLLTALFDISKLDTGIIRSELSDFPVDDMLRALESEHAVLAERKGLALRVLPCSAVIRSDVLLLRRIVQNFISNAIRYTNKGRVLVGCRRREAGISIEVWDTGPGIAEQNLGLIFEEFQRFAPADAAEERGLGLGLAIAQRSARVLGHELRVRSRPGWGTVFAVDVPYGILAHPDPAERPPAPTRDHGLGSAVVAFVENDAVNLEAMSALLERWACRVVRGRTAAEVCRALDTVADAPDLVIADYHLDDGRVGLDAITEIQAFCNLPIPAIVVTADHSADVVEKTREAGYEQLQKPIKPAELRSLMAHLMR